MSRSYSRGHRSSRKNANKENDPMMATALTSFVRREFIERKKSSMSRKRPLIEREPDCSAFPFLGYQVNLPYGIQPYTTQKKMIVKILMGLNRKENVMIESPTGSGKTLGLLSSTCEWLCKHKQRYSESVYSCPQHGENAGAYDVSMQSIGDVLKEKTNESQALNSDKKPEASSSGIDEFGDESRDIFDDSPVEEPDILTKAIAQFDEDQNATFSKFMASQVDEIESLNKTVNDSSIQQPACTCEPRVRVYYASRTHRQIAQVVKEFSRLVYGHRLRHTILGSREQLCVNEGVRASHDMTSRCKELLTNENGVGCSFREKLKANFPQSSPKAAARMREEVSITAPKVWDVEDLREALTSDHRSGMCPYFTATRLLTVDSDIIFCPFSYLIDPIIRESSDVHLKNSVVILDEAHNVEDFCREAASFQFTDREAVNSCHSVAEKCMEIDVAIKHMSKEQAQTEEVFAMESSTVAQARDQLNRLGEYQKNLNIMHRYLSAMHSWILDISNSVRQNCENSEQTQRQSQRGGIFNAWGASQASTQWDSGKRFSNTKHFADLYASLERHQLLLIEEKLAETIKGSFAGVVKTTVTGDEAQGENQDFLLSKFKPSSEAIVFMEKMLHFQAFFLLEGCRAAYRLNIAMEEENSDGFATQKGYMEQVGGKKDQAGFLSTRNLMGIKVPEKPRVLDGWKATIGLWCMSPSLAFQGAFSTTRSVVLASGTLTPSESFEAELGIPFQHKLEGEQVVPEEQIFASGPTGHQLVATYNNTSGENSIFAQEIARICLSISERTPGGVLCFFPSYRLMTSVTGVMDRMGLMNKLRDVKAVFSEPRRSSELGPVMEEFNGTVRNPKKYSPRCTGAIMFAVFRGKVSEGIDFTDELARCVISIGIPFPNTKDDQVLEKKKFNDERKTKCPSDVTSISGDAWYTIQAYRALNQALGRCLRHRNDWGAIVLVDQRLSHQLSPEAPNKISRWIRKCLRGYGNYGQFERELTNFMRERETLMSGCPDE
ncbi:unnamed protein product, partial [Mesorhabditis belari]|uniref:DNA helicase n=1 Tax=Mesorhabditis belari TaxID=2138241 RepID=A0AAF3F1D7_9BILA